MALNTSNDLKKIMAVSSDFLSNHQIMSVRRYKRSIPEWATDDKQIQKLLLSKFPRLGIDLEQRRRAGRWAMVIQLYFRAGHSHREVAEEMGESKAAVLTLTRSIVRAQRSEPLNGVLRKKKKSAIIQTGLGETR